MKLRLGLALPILGCIVIAAPEARAAGVQPDVPQLVVDTDQDGLPDPGDACPVVQYAPSFSWSYCAPTDGNPANDTEPECKARERVIQTLLTSGVFTTHIAFAVVQNGLVHFADAFSYIGQGQYVHDPAGVHRLYRIGSTTKAMVATTAKILEERGELSLNDFVNDDDATQLMTGGERTLRQLLGHRGAFKVDSGALHLFCYAGDLAAFWSDPDDLVSPHYDSATYGNLGGGYQYSAFNYSLAGAYLANRTGETFAEVLQTRLFDPAGMCTAMLDGLRAKSTPIGNEAGVSQASVMHVGPYINLTAPTDPRCVDNFYSSNALPGDPYTYQIYNLDEAAAEARDPAGGVIASVIDVAHFMKLLLAGYHGRTNLLSSAGIRDLWGAVSSLGCTTNCAYAPYYGTGFFTNSQPNTPVTQVEHGGSRTGFASGMVLRPEADLGVVVLANADVSTVALSNLAKAILTDLEVAVAVEPEDVLPEVTASRLTTLAPNPLERRGTIAIRFAVARAAHVDLQVFDVRGRSVARLANGEYQAGDHGVQWSPAAEGVAPGTYFIRFEAGGDDDVQKIVVAP